MNRFVMALLHPRLFFRGLRAEKDMRNLLVLAYGVEALQRDAHRLEVLSGVRQNIASQVEKGRKPHISFSDADIIFPLTVLRFMVTNTRICDEQYMAVLREILYDVPSEVFTMQIRRKW